MYGGGDMRNDFDDTKGFSLREEFAANLNDYAKIYGKSQADLCEETGIPKSTMSQYFSGQRYPRPFQLAIIANCFRNPVAKLIGEQTPDTERVEDLPIELRIIARRGLMLTPDERKALLRYCTYVYPHAFGDGGAEGD